MPPFRTHRHPHPDLTGPLRHRDQQDVHNPDAADQERDGGHGRQHQGQRLAGPLAHLGEFHLGLDRKVIRLLRLEPVADAQDLLDGLHCLGQLLLRLSRGVQAADRAEELRA